MKLNEIIKAHGLVQEESISDEWLLYSANGWGVNETIMLAVAQGEALDIIVTRQFDDTDKPSIVLKLNRLDPVLDEVLGVWAVAQIDDRAHEIQSDHA